MDSLFKSHSPNASEANVNQVIPLTWPGRHMGPPHLNYPPLPQPVEIEPGSYPRAPGSYSSWEPTPYSVGSLGEPSPPVSNPIGHNKSGPVSLDFGPRNSPQDPITNWYTDNDGPWIPKGAVPEFSHDERIHTRGHTSYRNSGYGSPPGIRHRPGNPSENGSVPFGISPSDSGYGTGVSLESASVRGSDIVDHSQNNRSLLGRVPELHRYNERGPARESHGTEQWPYNSPSAPLYHCPTCNKRVKTKSELKKHHLRHTKPFRCQNPSCNRTEGFSTINDLNRHKQSKHPGDLSGEIQSKKYHCLVPGCKSQDKIWPRLDNFRSHLKRMHRLREDAMDQFVHRGEMDQRTKGSIPSQGTSSESPSRLDQDVPLGLGSDDFPELSYPSDHPQWGPVSPSPLERQTEITDQLLENPDVQTLVPPNGDNPIGLEDDPERPMILEGRRASWDSDSRNGCLKNGSKLTSSDTISESMAIPITNSLGSPVGTLESTDTVERGKTSKLKKASSIDPCLREAIITAVFSTASPGKDNGSDPEFKSLAGVGSPGVVHVSEISPSRMDSKIALPAPAAVSGRHPDDQDPCLDASSGSASDKRDLTDQDATIQRLLQVIKDAGYVLKKENKSQAGIGQNVNNLGSSSNKKRDPVPCSFSGCKFGGRPCELKKHMKRHTRPYGCTFSKCPKTFGSKNDWKRHETSQHYQHESWRCDEKTDGASCTKVFFSADIARAHFTKVHKVTDPDAIQQKINGQRVGANYQAHFWCGFCEQIIDLTQKGVDGWTERFNHIDDHFMGKNGRNKQPIAQWKADDSDGEGVQHNALAQSRSPNDSGDLETSDDSSPSSSDTSSASPDTSIMPPSPDATATPQKRKRADSDEQSGRSKHPKHSKSELRIQCCECGFQLNPKIETACPNGHNICNGCEKKQVNVYRDSTK